MKGVVPQERGIFYYYFLCIIYVLFPTYYLFPTVIYALFPHKALS